MTDQSTSTTPNHLADNSVPPDLSASYSYQLLLINGPNLNLLGKREPDIYGFTTLDDIQAALTQRAALYGVTLICVQSNHEGALIDTIQHHGLLASSTVDAMIFNPAAFTHTSVAIRDAILATQKPFIEVHLSNVHQREAFRQQSYFSDIASGVICGLGAQGYHMALDYWLANLYNIQPTSSNL